MEVLSEKSSFTSLVLEYFAQKVPFRGSFWSTVRKKSLSAARFGALSKKSPFTILILEYYLKKAPFRGSF